MTSQKENANRILRDQGGQYETCRNSLTAYPNQNHYTAQKL